MTRPPYAISGHWFDKSDNTSWGTSLPTHVYDRKGNLVRNDDDKISGVDKATDISGVDEDNDKENEYYIKHEDIQDTYDTTLDDMDEDVEPNYQ